MRRLRRFLRGPCLLVSGLGLGILALWMFLYAGWIAAIASKTPVPEAVNEIRDMCCPTPTSWGKVALGAVYAAVVAALAALVATAASSFVVRINGNRGLPGRRYAASAGIAMAVPPLIIVVAQLVP